MNRNFLQIISASQRDKKGLFLATLGEIPEFEEVLQAIKDLEEIINQSH